MTKNKKDVIGNNVIKTIAYQSLMVASGLCTTVIPCVLSKKNPPSKVSPLVKNSVNIVNSLSVLYDVLRNNFSIDGTLPYKIDPFGKFLIPYYIADFNPVNFNFNEQNLNRINFRIGSISYVGGMIFANIIIDKHDKIIDKVNSQMAIVKHN